MAECDAQDFVEASKCFMCLDDKQRAVAQLALLCGILKGINNMAECDVQSLLEAGKCFNCLDNRQINIVRLQLLCEILQSGGQGTTSCNMCGTEDPHDAPICDYSIYTRTDTAEMWYWNPASTKWVKVISNT